jgi:signal transduction histidine kinase
MVGHRWFQRLRIPGFALVLRLSLSLATLGISVLHGTGQEVAPWVISVTAADLLIYVVRHWRPDIAETWMFGLIGALTAIATMAVQTAGATALLLLLIPGIHAGLALGRVGALLAGWVSLIVGYAMIVATPFNVFEGVEIIGLMGVVFLAALIAVIWHEPGPDKNAVAAQEAKALLIRLGSLADSLDTGFDVPALADWALAEIDELVGVERGAVLLRTEGDAVVVGLRGHTRMPWPVPTDPGSVLHRTWSECVSVRGATGIGLERSFVLTVPLTIADGTAAGMIAVDRGAAPFSWEDQRTVESVAHRIEPLIEVGILFSRLRGRAVVEERARLARDIHDGVAQEIAALAFTVDLLVQQTPPDDPVRAGLESLRTSMRHSLADLRNQISTLRMVERPGVSLGAVLSTTMQQFATNTSLRTRMTVDESPFRFPAHLEMQIQRLALDVIADARATGATFVDCTVWLWAPNARLTFAHDGASAVTQEEYAGHPLTEHGRIVVDSLIPQGVYVEVRLGTEAPPSPRVERSERTVTEAGNAEVPLSGRERPRGGGGGVLTDGAHAVGAPLVRRMLQR